MRFPYTFAVPQFGGRNWTVVSALLLLIPSVALVVLVRHPEAPFWLMALAASTAGLGGGNFASSMANISFFYPDRKKGLALGLNAAGGNIGVSTDVAAGRVEAEGEALLPVGIEEGDVRHAGGEVAASQARRRGGERHQPERRLRVPYQHDQGHRGDEQEERADYRPVAPAEPRHGERVGEAHERSDQARQRHEREELRGGVLEPDAGQLGRGDAPDEPHRESQVLGENRPDEIAARDRFSALLPEFDVLRVPVLDPPRHVVSRLETGKSGTAALAMRVPRKPAEASPATRRSESLR